MIHGRTFEAETSRFLVRLRYYCFVFESNARGKEKKISMNSHSLKNLRVA